ncbi:MAG: hypothetical protein ACK53Y_21770, partial [bacterium]
TTLFKAFPSSASKSLEYNLPFRVVLLVLGTISFVTESYNSTQRGSESCAIEDIFELSLNRLDLASSQGQAKQKQTNINLHIRDRDGWLGK